MRRVVVPRHGGPEVLEIEEVPAPEPGAGELLVEVAVVVVSVAVVRQSRGDVALPHLPGGEVAGRVAAVGPDVTGWRVGERVAGLAFTGAYAEVVAVPAALAAPVPDGVDDACAAALVRGGQVALGVLRASGMRDGERVLVTSAASGTGHLAVQLARTFGAGRVVAAAGDAVAKRAFLADSGADDVVAYDEAAARWGGPFDVVLDGTGGPVQTTALDLLAPWGRLVSYNAHGVPVDVDVLRLHARSVIGFAMAPLVRERPEVYRRHRDELWRLHLDGRLRPRVHVTLPLERAAEAHRVIEARENAGRVLLAPS